MSDSVTVTGRSAVTIYGLLTEATDYIGTMFGPTFSAWMAATSDIQKQTLIAATRGLDAQAWDPDTAGNFATRDAIAIAGSPYKPFAQASYELAVMLLDDPTILQAQDQGTNVRAVGAGSARVEFFNPSSAQFGTAPILPATIMRFVGQYLASVTANTGGAPEGQAGGCESPFSDRAEYKRWWPY